MKFSAYIVHPKHRNKPPTKDASIWSCDEWEEIVLFSTAVQNEWYSEKEKSNSVERLYWSMKNISTPIGNDLKYVLFMAKFHCNHNQEWHGYPVHPQGEDIPPEPILNSWLEKNIIDPKAKLAIKRGKFNGRPR